MIHPRSFITLVILCILSLTAHAHEITPSILQLSHKDSNSYQLTIDANIEAMMTGIGSEHNNTDNSPVAIEYNTLRALPVEQVNAQATTFAQTLPQQMHFSDANASALPLDIELVKVTIAPNPDLSLARESQITYRITAPKSLSTVRFQWAKPLGDAVFKVTQGETNLATLWVRAGDLSKPVTFNASAPTQGQAWLDYVIIGFEHILPLGLDHILFVIGLYLLSQRLAPLLWQVTAFTVAHTITLALATLGIFTLSPAIVEPLIAASITFVALENLRHHTLTKFRLMIVFVFGLLHGMGFAGVLGEIGLNPSAFITSLIAFNIGVELGQLAVIAGMYLAFGFWLGKTQYWEKWFRTPLSIIIAMIGIFWFMERTLAVV
ncbi:MAG TPA: HupE/UreJ family protein [Campylobacterales bacterium]|nr:HupE/UreJ family protein [Campylobacterales bacterium]